MNTRVIDVSKLPTYAFGHRSVMWWGTLGMVAIEGTVFAIALTVYYYLRGLAREWPIAAAPPDLVWGTTMTVLLLVSCLPNHLAKKAAEQESLRGVRLWVGIVMLSGVVALAVRVAEFPALNTHWQSNAYGSIVYALIVLHTVHLLTDFIDTVVLEVLLFTGPLNGRRFVDVSENADYWWFVVIAWLPIYFTVYLVPRISP
jgi:heme/copper-type cytochrome/quinol oxidase subunit 3